MKVRLKTYHLALLLLTLILAPIGILTLTLAQTKPSVLDAESRNVVETCNHNLETREGWDNLRSLQVKITSTDGDTIHWIFRSRHSLDVGSFVLDKGSVFVSDVKLNMFTFLTRSDFNRDFNKDQWVVMYCGKCFLAFSLRQVH